MPRPSLRAKELGDARIRTMLDAVLDAVVTMTRAARELGLSVSTMERHAARLGYPTPLPRLSGYGRPVGSTQTMRVGTYPDSDLDGPPIADHYVYPTVNDLGPDPLLRQLWMHHRIEDGAAVQPGLTSSTPTRRDLAPVERWL